MPYTASLVSAMITKSPSESHTIDGGIASPMPANGSGMTEFAALGRSARVVALGDNFVAMRRLDAQATVKSPAESIATAGVVISTMLGGATWIAVPSGTPEALYRCA